MASLAISIHAVVLAAASAPAPTRWTVFEPYPHARLLCTQRLYGVDKKSHFTWWTYASADAPEAVKTFYKQRHPEWQTSDTINTLRGPEDERLTVDAAADTRNYPSCQRKATAADKSVITVTSGTVRRNKLTYGGFDGATTGCGNAVVTTESRDGRRSLRLTLDATTLPLSADPKTFALPHRGVDLEVFTGSSRPRKEILCHDPRTPSVDPFTKLWTGIGGRIVVSVTPRPPENPCYKVSVRFEGVLLRGTEPAQLANMELKDVPVGGDKHRDCAR